MYTILVCDDDRDIVSALDIYLTSEGYRTVKAYDGLEAIKAVEAQPVDLILMDIMMPGLDGIRATAKLREKCNVPIILLTAKSEDADKVLGLNIGADDYITKPFSMPVVMKRIEAVLRRAEQGSAAPSSVIRYKEITLDTDSLTVLVGALSVSLTAREFDILKLLLENQGRVVSREKLLDSIWGYGYIGDEKIVNTHIKNIRKKLGVDYIETIRGAGYKIEKEN